MSEPIYFCAFEGFTLDYGLPKWPESPPKVVTWHTDGGLPGVSPDAFKATAAYAWEGIMAVCGLRLEYTPNGKTANILMMAAPLGTPGMGNRGGVLADSMLPVGLQNNQAQMLQRYDSEVWSSEDHAPPGKIPLPTVMRHEGCHAFGLPHGGQDLMAPTLNSKIAFPGEWTIAELVKRYGKAGAAPPPPPPPAGPTDWLIKAGTCEFRAAGDVQIFRGGVRQRVEPSPFG